MNIFLLKQILQNRINKDDVDSIAREPRLPLLIDFLCAEGYQSVIDPMQKNGVSITTTQKKQLEAALLNRKKEEPFGPNDLPPVLSAKGLSTYGFNRKVYEEILALTKLACVVEGNQNPEEHAYKLTVLFGSSEEALKYLEHFYKSKGKTTGQPIHDACLFSLPDGNAWDIPLWRTMAREHLPNPTLEKVLPWASQIEDYVKQNQEILKKGAEERADRLFEERASKEKERRTSEMAAKKIKLQARPTEAEYLKNARESEKGKKELDRFTQSHLRTLVLEELQLPSGKKLSDEQNSKLKNAMASVGANVVAEARKKAEADFETNVKSQYEKEYPTLESYKAKNQVQFRVRIEKEAKDKFEAYLREKYLTKTKIKKEDNVEDNKLDKRKKGVEDIKKKLENIQLNAEDLKEKQKIQEELKAAYNHKFTVEFKTKYEGETPSQEGGVDKSTLAKFEEAKAKSDEKEKSQLRSVEIERVLSPKTPLSILEGYMSQLSYTRADENRAAAALFFEHGLSEKEFEQYLRLMKLAKDNPRTFELWEEYGIPRYGLIGERGDQYREATESFSKIVGAPSSRIPDVTIEGASIGHSGYYLKKLDPTDPRAAVLGKLTACCQSLGGQGYQCAIHGMTNPNGGFYVLCRGEANHPKLSDEVVAQSWVWRSREDNLVLDSIESQPKMREESSGVKMIADFYAHLGKRLVADHNVNRVTFGESTYSSHAPHLLTGIDSSFEKGNRETPRADYMGYRDSDRGQVLLASRSAQGLLLVEAYLGNRTAIQKYTSENPTFWEPEEQFRNLCLKLIKGGNPNNHLILNDLLTALPPKVKKENSSLLASLLTTAVESNQVFCLKALVEHGVVLKTNTEHTIYSVKSGIIPSHLEIAAKFGSMEVLDYIYQNYSKQIKDQTELDAFKAASEMGRVNVVDYLTNRFKSNTERTQQLKTYLVTAAGKGQFELVKQLLQGRFGILFRFGSELNPAEKTVQEALHVAIGSGHFNIVHYLTRMGVNLNTKINGKAALHQLREYMNSKPFYFEPDVITAITEAKKILDEFLSKGADPYLPDSNGDTWIKWVDEQILKATAERRPAISEAYQALKKSLDEHPLLQKRHGEEKTKKAFREKVLNDETMLSKIEEECTSGNVDFIIDVIKKGFDVNHQFRNGETLLMIAAKHGHSDLVNALINNHANVNAADEDGDVVITYAIDEGHIDIVKQLLDTNQIDLRAKNKEQEPVLMRALRSTSMAIA